MQQGCPMMLMQPMNMYPRNMNPMMIESQCSNCLNANNGFGMNQMYRNFDMNNYMPNQNLFYVNMKPVSIEEIED
jgi:hypothetical protein